LVRNVHVQLFLANFRVKQEEVFEPIPWGNRGGSTQKNGMHF
jgi:hypothetical protein